MDELQPKRCLFQFTLRKLILWTGVWAIYLGSVRAMEMGPIAVTVLTLCLVALLAIRIAWGYERGAIRAGLVAGLALNCLGAVFAVDVTPEPWIASVEIFIWSLFWPFGFVLGFFALLSVDLVVRAVDSLDNLMVTRPPPDTP